MRLTQIKLSGFKSFVDLTAIQVPGQLVGVVGPNGCGKSNIIDAVRWVLGESKASELRGESMQDVIFNGSGHRKPAARASVELIFDNSLGRAAGQWSLYAEIAVKRVLTRDGTSSYFLNNQQVRRRDIHDVFMGTGLGPRAYAIIGQGMISQIIEAKPEELRVFLEEAAGVSRYKERRRETEHRLSDTRDNLSRVDDILKELEGQLEKLTAQAEVAQQFQAFHQEQEHKQQLLWWVKQRDAKSQRLTYAQEISQVQIALENATAQLRHVQSEIETQRQAHYSAGDAVHKAQGDLYEANSTLSRIEAEIKYVTEARERLFVQIGSLQEQKQQWQEQIDSANHELEQLDLSLSEAIAKHELSFEELEQAQQTLPELESQSRQQSHTLGQQRERIAQLQQEFALLNQQRQESARLTQAKVERQMKLQHELAAIVVPDNLHIEALSIELQDAVQQLNQAQQALTALESELLIQDPLRQQAQQALQREMSLLTQLQARYQALDKLQKNVQSQGKLASWLQEHNLQESSRLWQSIQVEIGWENAVEAILREKLHALTVTDVQAILAFENNLPPAKVSFLSLPDKLTDLTKAYTATPALGRSLATKVKSNNTVLMGLISAWLADVYTTDSLTEAWKARDQLPPQGIWIVPQGHTVSPGLCSFYAADSEQAGMLARQQEIDDLAKQIKAQEIILSQAKSALHSLETNCQHLVSEISSTRRIIDQAQRRRHDLELQQNRLDQAKQQAEQQLERVQHELGELAYEQETLAVEADELAARTEESESHLTIEQHQLEEFSRAYSSSEHNLQTARSRLREMERAATEAEFTVRSLRARLEEAQRSKSLSTEQLARSDQEIARLQQELNGLDDGQAQANLQAALVLRTERENNLSTLRSTLDELSEQMRQTDEQRLLVEQKLDPLRQQITEIQLKEQASRLQQEQYEQQLIMANADTNQLQASIEGLGKEWQRPSWLDAELQRVSKSIQALGSVNLAALDELNTSQERQKFILAQHGDLTEAINTLEDAIRKIDKETRQLLQETFNTVNRHFGELFPLLFGGGEARLSMTGEEILDAGVQVLAQPPGKRNSTIHLLSGGEKALTAIALVFSLFRLNPAPFCLLDEVDAPLDDSNTERFARMVKRMSEQTQFLFISHNKIAMEMAQQLVGVTMQEQGVSRIVAVDLESAIQLAAEAA